MPGPSSTTAWANSNRRSRLPSDWPKRRAAVKRRAGGMCEASSHVAECDGTGSECDHIVRGDNHTLTNLQWLSEPCHKAKTNAERGTRKRAQEPHPGLIS